MAGIFGNVKAAEWIRGRKKDRLFSKTPPSKACTWIHASSAGEFEQAIPLIESLKKAKPDECIIVTFFSPSGYSMYRSYPVFHVGYLPLDYPSEVGRFIDYYKPYRAFFIKYELWRNAFAELDKRSIPIYIVSFILRDDHIINKPWSRFFYRKMLSSVRFFFCQDESTVQHLSHLGFNNADVVGDTRFERVYNVASQNFNALDQWLNPNKKILLAGSTWPSDDALLSECLLQLSDDYSLMIFPHRLDPLAVEECKKAFKNTPLLCRYSQSEPNTHWRVLIVDTPGILKYAYRHCYAAWIGGGLDKGGIHNCIEAAVYGKAVFFGPVYKKYIEAVGLIAANGAKSVSTASQLSAYIIDYECIERMGLSGKSFCDKQRGSIERIMNEIEKR
jgi:3-deoxy-D-manno-octulosonic-acid transferase